MKKIILSISLLLFACAVFVPCLAQEDAMPSDKEIMEAIEKFNFDETQKEFLFKETKKKLQQMQESGEIGALIQQHAVEEDFGESSPTQTTGVSRSKSSDVKKKKYASHDPLVKKQHVGQRKTTAN